ncbi:MAG: FAD-binding-2 domain-containing protein [Burkholderia sp.]|jgi:fumarate reductase flavoprotein subunit
MSSEISRRGLIKAGMFGAVAAGACAVTRAASAEEGKADDTYDVIVIGCGCAGMSAAIEAKKAGAKVCLLDKMARPSGNTIFSGGIINAAGTYVQKQEGVQDSLEAFYKDMMAVSQNRGDPALTKMYVEKSADAVQWLTDECGVKFRKLEKEAWPVLQRAHVVDGPLKPHGAQLAKQLLDRVKALGVPVFFNTKVIEITRNEVLHATGVKAVNEDDELVTLKAKGGVIVCTGGFHNNKELICRYMGGDVAWMPIRGSTCITGENITLTAQFNPRYVNMDQFHGGPIHGPTRANPSIMVNYGILVKQDGTRFIDEVNTYVHIAKAMPKIIPNNWAFIVIDDQVTGISTVKDRIGRYERAHAPIYQGNTIAELAKNAGIPEKTLVKVVADYNAAVKAGKGASLTPPNTLKNARLIEKPPFRAFPFQGGMTATFGGPKISLKGEVLNTEGHPIPGLYAAGNAIGGLLYSDYIAGSQLCSAIIWGREAARNAAARAKKAA